ncbi:MAG: lysyl endopeptidase [Proteobacteria bacterium]|nr:lysyl endopeptidase [Pseudomonadota bacterium]
MNPLRTFSPLLASACLAALLPAAASAAPKGYSGIFGGGPLYITSKGASQNITELENSGFTEIIVWSVEVKPNGDLNLNGEFPLTSNGVYIGDQTYPAFASDMARLKQGKVKRVTFSIGSSNFGDWEDIAALVQNQGTGPDSILYKTFAALKAAIPAIDAIDFDDENSFDLASTVQFGVMLGQMGYHVMPDPYFDAGYWKQVVSQINTQLPGTVDGVHLQAYAGGAGNSPCNGWDFGTVPVFPFLWDANDTPAQVYERMHNWHTQCAIVGGGLWLYDDLVGTGETPKYAKAINLGVRTRR